MAKKKKKKKTLKKKKRKRKRLTKLMFKNTYFAPHPGLNVSQDF